MTFFFDECVSYRIAQALKCLGYDTAYMEKAFGKGALDVDWLPLVGERGWVLVTVDGKIRNNSMEQAALRKANIVSVFLYGGYGQLPGWDEVVYIIKHWPQIVVAVEKAHPGDCLGVAARGKVEPKT